MEHGDAGENAELNLRDKSATTDAIEIFMINAWMNVFCLYVFCHEICMR